MIGSDAFEALCAYLDGEETHLAALESLLREEQGALRRLDVSALGAVASAKAERVAAHQAHAAGRAAALTRCAPADTGPRSLSALSAFASDDQRERLDARRRALAALVRRVQALQAMNEAYARTGRGVVESALTRLHRRQGAPVATYGADGRVRGRAANAERGQG